MADGRVRCDWAHTSSLMALLANAHRDPKKGRSFTPNDFNPYRENTQRRGAVKISANELAAIFVKGQVPESMQ